MGHPAPTALASVDTLDNLYPMMSELNITCGWHRPAPALWPEPKKNFVPYQWRYAHAKAALDAAGRLIDTSLAERRNLILFNPIEGNHYATARTIISAYQMVLPGEVARSHRHVPNALRFVLDAEPGMFTIVNGEALEMLPGDVLLTPNWSWHGHHNEGKAPAYWLDFLDVPLVQLLEPMFFEHYPTQYEAVRDKPQQSPFVFKWSDSERRLGTAADTPHYGHQIELGEPAMNTMGLFMQRIERGRTTRRLQTTANNVYAVFRGHGTTVIDGERFDWSKGDVIVAPGWRPHHHEAHGDAVLFRVTDAPVQQRLGLLRTAS